jgi:hypothetical protein
MLARFLAIGSLILLVAHYTGSMKYLLSFFDSGIDTTHLLYLTVMPFVCVVGLVLLRDPAN